MSGEPEVFVIRTIQVNAPAVMTDERLPTLGVPDEPAPGFASVKAITGLILPPPI